MEQHYSPLCKACHDYEQVTKNGVPLYYYSFFLWPHEGGKWSKALYEYFAVIKTRFEWKLTEEEFGLNRAGLERDGFTLREIERQLVTPTEAVL